MKLLFLTQQSGVQADSGTPGYNNMHAGKHPGANTSFFTNVQKHKQHIQMNIIIPMAGMGKRMRPHTLTTAKPLIPVAGKPVVQRLVEDILATCNEKVEEIAFVTNPDFGKDVEAHLLEVAKSLGAKGKICYQEAPLGTAHAILAAGDILNGNVF